MIIFLTLLISLNAFICFGKICPDRNTTGKLKFTRKTNGEDFVKSGRSYQLVCCATGFTDHVTWQMFQKNPPKNVSFPPPNPNRLYRQPETSEDGQVISIEAKKQYNTTFTCLAGNATANITKTTRLFVIDCDHLHGNPLVIEKPQDIRANVGDNVTFACGGYFGCYDSEFRDVFWLMHSENNSNIFIAPSDYSPRYSVVKYSRLNKTRIFANLTIEDVQESDFEINFTCSLARPPPTGTINHVVQLHKIVIPPRINKLMIIILSVAITLGCIAFLCVVFLISYAMWGPQIRLFVRRKTGRLMKPGQYRYDLVIVGANEDEEIAGIIEEELQKRGHRVFGPRDIAPGSPELKILGPMSNSAVHAFLHSKNTKGGTMVEYLFNCVGAGKNWDNINIVVIYLDDQTVRWSRVIEASPYGQLVPDGATNDSEDMDGEVLLPDNRYHGNRNGSIPDSVWQKFKSVHWPGKEASARRIENFYSELETHLPATITDRN